MFIQVIENFRFQIVQPYLDEYEWIQDLVFLEKYKKIFRDKVLKIYGLSQLYAMVNHRDRFYSLIDDICEKFVTYFLKDLLTTVKLNIFDSFQHMNNELTMIIKYILMMYCLYRAKIFWNVKDMFLQTYDELLQSFIIRHRIMQAFDNIQVILGITNSIFTDFFQFSFSTEIYKVFF